MTEAPLSELPRVLARPPWISGRPSRELVVVEVAAKKASEEALTLFDATSVFGGWRSDKDGSAWQYFETHVEATLVAVLPIAVGEKGPRRKVAERVVRDLAVKNAESVRAVAARYGKRATASVAEILAVDRRFDCPNAPPDLPPSFRADTFARPRLRDGRAMPVEAVRRIGQMLAFSSLDRPYAGLADVIDACEPRSLAELAWDMGRAWEAAGALVQDAWMLESLACLGDDAVIRRTTPAIASPYVIHVLGYAACTRAAATELCTIAWRASHEKAPNAARTRASVDAAFARIARRCGLTAFALEDSLVPGVADDSAPLSSRLAALRAKSIDARINVPYGSRALVVGFDERLDAFVQTAGGTRMRELPKPLDGDDRGQIASAEQVWRELQEDIAAIADLRIRSLEKAMTSGRTWTPDDFRRAWLEHPLMRHVALGVVWTSGATAFRVAEDGTFADVDDATLEGVTEIGVANPAEMTDDEKARWAAVLADYRIIQPIDQIAQKA